MVSKNAITANDGVLLTNKFVERKLLGITNDLAEMNAYLATARGNGIRTQLLMRSAINDNGFVDSKAVNVAAAIELLHMATLVHDDVMDDAPVRRGLETVQKKFGVKKAVICGDYLLCISMDSISDLYVEDPKLYTEAISVMTKTLSRLCLGEYRQFSSNGNLDISISNYLRIIGGKTAELFFAAAYCGARISDAPACDINNTARFGRNLGMIFQIIDDCKDYEFSESAAKKSVKNDIISGVVTLPLIFAMRSVPAVKLLAREVMLNQKSVDELADSVIKAGGLETAKNVAVRYKEKALQALSGLKNAKKKSQLLELLEGIPL
ncbi:MAG: polyprenyl synthetase family protein [Clostridiales bacterium]|jgi:heptaprenyl diphosphate synthase|nr:polyprenyl synthetase family protein [Clostridiales bacterium]